MKAEALSKPHGSRTIHGQSPRILLVDDEPVARETIRALLVEGGYRVEPVDSAERALACLQTKSYDAVVTDNNMPGLSGLEMAAIIKACWSSLPIVMFSGNPPSEQPPYLDLVLLKPNDIVTLVDELDRLFAAQPR